MLTPSVAVALGRLRPLHTFHCVVFCMLCRLRPALSSAIVVPVGLFQSLLSFRCGVCCLSPSPCYAFCCLPPSLCSIFSCMPLPNFFAHCWLPLLLFRWLSLFFFCGVSSSAELRAVVFCYLFQCVCCCRCCHSSAGSIVIRRRPAAVGRLRIQLAAAVILLCLLEPAATSCVMPSLYCVSFRLVPSLGFCICCFVSSFFCWMALSFASSFCRRLAPPSIAFLGRPSASSSACRRRSTASSVACRWPCPVSSVACRRRAAVLAVAILLHRLPRAVVLLLHSAVVLLVPCRSRSSAGCHCCFSARCRRRSSGACLCRSLLSHCCCVS
jgi:hypothetical protein